MTIAFGWVEKGAVDCRILDFGDGFKKFFALRRVAVSVVAEVEGHSGLAILIGLHADPLGFQILGEDVVGVAIDLDTLIVLKVAIALPVNLQGVSDGLVRGKVHDAPWEAMDQKRVGRNACRHRVIHVN